MVRLVYVVTDAGHAHNSPCRPWLLISIVMQGRTGCGTIAAMGPWLWGEEARALEPGCPSPGLMALQETRHFLLFVN